MDYLWTSIVWTLLLIYATVFIDGQKSTVSSKCKTPDDKMGTCISLRECHNLLQLLRSRGGEPGVGRFLRSSQCRSSRNDPIVCCPSIATSNAVNSSKESTSSTTDVCGVPDISRKIIGGEQAQLGDYPWMTALGYKTRRHPAVVWLCGGSLISSRYVLTAAHCLLGTEPWELYKVRLGDLDLKDSVEDEATPLDVLVERAIIHQKHNSTKLINDIALVKLRSRVEFTNLIKPICLPKASELQRISLEDQYAYVAGWGKTSYSFSSPSTDTYSTRLLDLKIPILNTTVCKKAYQHVAGTNVDDRNICAGYIKGHKDSCQGDSGGPLMWINASESKYYLVGVVSFGYKCAEPGYPGVYTRVSSYIDWIESNAI